MANGSSDYPSHESAPAGDGGRGAIGLRFASLSDVGVTRSENQDACGEFEDGGGGRLLVLADGMGGHRGGATASRICVETVGELFVRSDAPLGERLRSGIERANQRVWSGSQSDPDLRGMGTTAVALAFGPDRSAWIGWVGDSRGYRLRSGRLEPLTEDHSVVAEWVRMGVLSAEEAETHERRNELLRCVGAQETVEVDVRPVEVRDGDRFLLCSDGLCGYVPEAEIAAVLGFEAPETAVRRLVEKANGAGGFDNVTVQIATVGGPAPLPDSALRAAPPPRDPPPRRPELRRLLGASGLVALLLLVALWYALTRGGGGVPVAGPPPVGAAREGPRALPPREPGREPPERSPFDPEGGASAPERGATGARRSSAEPGEPAREPGAVAPESPLPEEAIQAEIALLKPVAAPEPQVRVPDPGRSPDPAGEEAEPEPPTPSPSAESAVADAEVAAGGAASGPAVAHAPVSPAVKAGPAVAAAAGAAAAQPSTVEERIEREIRAFLDLWSRSVVEKDYALYRQLGFPESESEFERNYGRREGLELSFLILDHARPEPGVVNVRLHMEFGFDDRTGPHRTEKERRVVLRETERGLGYAGTWE